LCYTNQDDEITQCTSKMKAEIDKGDLVRLKVPPFNVGIVIDVAPRLPQYLEQELGRLIAVMFNDKRKLDAKSRLPENTTSYLEVLGREMHTNPKTCRALTSFFYKHVGGSINTLYGALALSSSHITVLFTHRRHVSDFSIVSKSEKSAEHHNTREYQ